MKVYLYTLPFEASEIRLHLVEILHTYPPFNLFASKASLFFFFFFLISVAFDMGLSVCLEKSHLQLLFRPLCFGFHQYKINILEHFLNDRRKM